MPLPSPIPHPLSFFGGTGWRRAVLDRVIGAGWPDGDERALRELAEQWHQAAREIEPLLEDADQAALAAVAALGGPDGRQAAALLELWRRIGTRLNVDLFYELGDLAQAGAAQIEAAKVAIYTELSSLLAELEILAATSDLTLGVSALCAEPAIAATRFTITQILRTAANELVEQGLKVAKATMPWGHFTFGVAGSAPELSGLDGTTGAEGAEAVQETGQGGDIVMIYGMGSPGRPQPAAQPTSLVGRFGERAISGRHGAVLSQVRVDVIAKTGVIAAPAPASPEATAALSSLDHPAPTRSALNQEPAVPDTRAATTAKHSGKRDAGLGSFTLDALAEAKDEADVRDAGPKVEPALLIAALRSVHGATAQDGAGRDEYERLIAGLVAAESVDWRELVGGPPAAVHQEALERAKPEQYGDLFGDWVRFINAGGPAADPRRATNGVDVVLAVLDTWLHGRPRVALAGTPENHERIERVTGGRFERLRPDEQGFARIEAVLRVEGHGACAVIVQEWEHGGVHATTVHNRHGEVFYLDAQRREQPVHVLPPVGAVRMEALALGPDATPIALADAE